jgi:hypothetical protein
VAPITFADTWIYLQDDHIWQEQQVGAGGDRPDGRSGHTLVPAVPNRSSFFMYGGLTNDINGTWLRIFRARVFACVCVGATDGVWESIHVHHRAPPTTNACDTALCGAGLVVKSDMWILSVDLKSSGTWTHVYGDNDGNGKTWPPARTQHSAALISNATMYVFGGVTLMLSNEGCDPDSVVTEDSDGCWGPSDPNNGTVWIGEYNSDEGTVWSLNQCHHTPQKPCPPALSEHTIVVYNKNMYVYGGKVWTAVTDLGSGEVLKYVPSISNQLWMLDQSGAWTNITATAANGWSPLGRYEHSAVVLGADNSTDLPEMHVIYGRVGDADYPE